MFRTCKYVPDFPADGFASLEAARAWVHAFVRWYNEENRHSRIRYVTPQQRHNGEDGAILAERQAIYEEAKAANPRRWSGRTRDWTPAGSVWLNPERAFRSDTEKVAA